jgi:hypothetical protein
MNSPTETDVAISIRMSEYDRFAKKFIGLIVMPPVTNGTEVITLSPTYVEPITTRFPGPIEFSGQNAEISLNGNKTLVSLCICTQEQDPNKPKFDPVDRITMVDPVLYADLQNQGMTEMTISLTLE